MRPVFCSPWSAVKPALREEPDVQQLILGSSSPFRREILAKLGLAFSCVSPSIDESHRTGELAEQLVMRLAEAKAKAAAGSNANALVIGSDQVAVLDGEIIGKPGDHASAVKQLRAAAGRRVEFHTGLTLFNSRTGRTQTVDERFSVHFRALSDDQIENYLQAEQPYNCAGSFKSEGLGIALFERLEGDDPNTLIGLPLIRLIAMLEAEGVRVI
jgi:MAF protein